ncbi:MAG TPA: fibronectin type III domain-containing protein [Patescibacteria group bacterium]|nr:fibronectin type III domain-containing protein [Patescibacteria group bacterium]
MKKKSTIPTILGILVLLVGLFAAVFFLRNAQVFRIGASAEAAPKDIRVGNITDNSATISWTTDKATSDFIEWGNSAGNTGKVESEDSNNQKYFSHSISLTGLSGNTNYFYKINSDGTTFDNGGIPWQLTTGASLSINKASVLLSGTVINATGTPEKKALIYANVGGYLLSTLTSDTGNFVFQLGSARTPDLANYAQINMDSTLVQISVVAPPDGVASAQIFPKSGNPVPTIVIGQVYDFRNQAANNQGGNPSVNLNLPENASSESKFNITAPSETPKPTSVILESLNEGETLTSTQPQFFGKGPGGETITIEVHSQDPIEATVQIPANGSWSYTVPTDLTPGNHTIKISWIDASGITRFLTRDFVVKAGEAPSFSASQSAATATPTVTPTASGSAKPTATPKVTLTPSPVASTTAMPVPVTGDLTPTLILFIMGLAVVAFSFVVWKIAEN